MRLSTQYFTGVLTGIFLSGTMSLIIVGDEAESHSVVETQKESLATELAKGNQDRPPKKRQPQSGTPHLTVLQPVYDFGTARQGSIVEHSFMLTNKGDAPLTIDKIRASCGCTATQMTSKIIQPNTSIPLRTRLNLTLQKGKQNKTITVYSNDPKNPVVTLKLQGESVTMVSLEPPRADLGVSYEASASRTVIVTAHEEISFNVLNTRTSAKNITVEVKEIEPGKKYEAKIQVMAPEKRGPVRGWVHLLTDHKGEYGVIGIPVEANFSDSQNTKEFKPVKKPVSQ